MAFGVGTVNAFGGAVDTLFSSRATASSLRLKATGDDMEAGNYEEAAKLAGQNAEFTKESTAVQSAMAERQIYLGIGKEQAEISGAGFANSGTALDLLRSSASQGALQKALVERQGQITEAGYEEQQKAYNNLASYASYSAGIERDQAGKAIRNGNISAGIKGAAALASFFV